MRCFSEDQPPNTTSRFTWTPGTSGELHRGAVDVVGIYWTKSGSFNRVAVETEAHSFLDGVPKGSEELTLRVGTPGGFSLANSKRGRDAYLELDAVVLCTHGGPGEDGTIQSVLILPASSTAGRASLAPRSGWTSSPLGPVFQRRVFLHCPERS